jgi:hypothetical protein
VARDGPSVVPDVLMRTPASKAGKGSSLAYSPNRTITIVSPCRSATPPVPILTNCQTAILLSGNFASALTP